MHHLALSPSADPLLHAYNNIVMMALQQKPYVNNENHFQYAWYSSCNAISCLETAKGEDHTWYILRLRGLLEPESMFGLLSIRFKTCYWIILIIITQCYIQLYYRMCWALHSSWFPSNIQELHTYTCTWRQREECRVGVGFHKYVHACINSDYRVTTISYQQWSRLLLICGDNRYTEYFKEWYI